jgi:hypothetical protein
MKKVLLLIFLLITGISSAQKTSSNKPELAKEILDGFVLDAENRGIEVKQRLSTITKILFLPGAKNEHWHKDGICTITINSNVNEPYELIFRAYHEIGHHLGLEDCALCSYNIMAAIKTGKTDYLFNNNPVRSLYLDIYFEAIRNPKKYNNGHTHY